MRTASISATFATGTHKSSRRGCRVAKKLQSREELMSLDELARQQVTMASIAWGKHSFLQLSMWLAPVGALLVFVSAL